MGKQNNFVKPITKSDKNAHFGIVHYAGTVSYNLMGWLEKNKDPLNDTVVEIMKNGSNKLVVHIFADHPGNYKLSKMSYILLLIVWYKFWSLIYFPWQWNFLGQNPDEEDEPPSKGKKGGGKRKQRQTVSTFYKAQLGIAFHDLNMVLFLSQRNNL